MLHRHYKRLKENRLFREAKLIFIPENNLGLGLETPNPVQTQALTLTTESAHLDTFVQDIPGVETFWEKDNRPGVCKDGKATRGYQFLLTNCLAQDGLHFDRDLFTVTREKTVQCMRELLMDQMLRFHW